MRHLGGIVIGFFGMFVGLVVIAAALGLTRRAVEQFTRAPLLLGTVLMLIGGAAIGAVAIFRRMSVAAPLTGAAVALLLTAAGLARAVLALPARDRPGVRRRPGDHDQPSGARAALAGVLLLTSLGVAAPRAAASTTGAAGPPTGPLPPYPQQPWGMPGPQR